MICNKLFSLTIAILAISKSEASRHKYVKSDSSNSLSDYSEDGTPIENYMTAFYNLFDDSMDVKGPTLLELLDKASSYDDAKARLEAFGQALDNALTQRLEVLQVNINNVLSGKDNDGETIANAVKQSRYALTDKKIEEIINNQSQNQNVSTRVRGESNLSDSRIRGISRLIKAFFLNLDEALEDEGNRLLGKFKILARRSQKVQTFKDFKVDCHDALNKHVNLLKNQALRYWDGEDLNVDTQKEADKTYDRGLSRQEREREKEERRIEKERRRMSKQDKKRKRNKYEDDDRHERRRRRHH